MLEPLETVKFSLASRKLDESSAIYKCKSIPKYF